MNPSFFEIIGIFTIYAAGLIIFSLIVWCLVGYFTRKPQPKGRTINYINKRI
jgi:hypothetical protein